MGITYRLCPFVQLKDQLIQNSETVMGLVELLIGELEMFGDMTLLLLLFFGRNDSRLLKRAISNSYALTDFIKSPTAMIFSLF